MPKTLVTLTLLLFTLLGCVNDENSTVDNLLSETESTNPPPVIVQAFVTPMTVYIYDTVTFTVEGTDNGTIDSLHLKDSAKEYAMTVPATDTTTHTAHFTDSGSYSVELVLEDNDGATSDPYTTPFRVELGRPSVSFLSEKLTVSLYDTIAVGVTAADSNPSGRVEGLYWYNNDTDITDTTTVDSLKVAYTEAGQKTIVVYSLDNHKQLSNPDTVVITVTAVKPTLDTLIGVPTAKGISMKAVGCNDIDGDNAKLQYIWYVNSVVVDTTDVDSIIFPYDEVGDVEVSVVALDEDNLLSEPRKSVVTIEAKIPPTVTIIEPVADTVLYNHGDVIDLAADWSDDSISRGDFTWYVAGEAQTGQADSSFSYTIDREDTFAIAVELEDVDGLVSKKDSVIVVVHVEVPSFTFWDRDLFTQFKTPVKKKEYLVTLPNYKSDSISITWDCASELILVKQSEDVISLTANGNTQEPLFLIATNTAGQSDTLRIDIESTVSKANYWYADAFPVIEEYKVGRQHERIITDSELYGFDSYYTDIWADGKYQDSVGISQSKNYEFNPPLKKSVLRITPKIAGEYQILLTVGGRDNERDTTTLTIRCYESFWDPEIFSDTLYLWAGRAKGLYLPDMSKEILWSENEGLDIRQEGDSLYFHADSVGVHSVTLSASNAQTTTDTLTITVVVGGEIDSFFPQSIGTTFRYRSEIKRENKAYHIHGDTLSIVYHEVIGVGDVCTLSVIDSVFGDPDSITEIRPFLYSQEFTIQEKLSFDWFEKNKKELVWLSNTECTLGNSESSYEYDSGKSIRYKKGYGMVSYNYSYTWWDEYSASSGTSTNRKVLTHLNGIAYEE